MPPMGKCQLGANLGQGFRHEGERLRRLRPSRIIRRLREPSASANLPLPWGIELDKYLFMYTKYI